MSFRDLREFIRHLEKQNAIRRISTPVSSELEITEITDRVSKVGGPALYFENVTGYKMPVVTNLMGSDERMSWALGVQTLNDLPDRIRSLLKLAQGPMPSGIIEKLRALGNLAEISSFGPKVVGKAPCQERILTDTASLEMLPVLKCWPHDGGRFVTLPMVVTANPRTGKRNVGMYRLQIFDERTTGMHWHIHKGGAEHYRDASSEGSRMPVAVALGADPAMIYAASAPLPSDIDEYLFAGFLRKEGLEIVKCQTSDLHVPAHCEIVLEGYVDPLERRIEGPFGDHTGFYSPAEEYPVFHLTCMTMRSDPIYPATIVGRPPMEDYYMGKATERLFLPLIQMIVPEVVDVNMPAEGVFHNLVVVSIRKEYPGHARKVMYALWGLMQMMLSKAIIIVDEDVNVQDMSEVLWLTSTNVDPRRDTVFADGPLDALDHSSPTPVYGSKIGIDATRKGPMDGHPREWPEIAKMSATVKSLVDQKWASYGLGTLPKRSQP